MTTQERIVDAMACSGNLFLVLTLPELRRRHLTPLAFYALQRAVEIAPNPGSTREFTEHWLRSETGLADYETSRACSSLANNGLIEVSKDKGDRRVRAFWPTDKGRRVCKEVLSAAAHRLWEGIPRSGRIRRVKEVTDHLRRANKILRGELQLSFFDTDLPKDQPVRKRTRRQAAPRSGTPAETQAP